MAAKQGRRIHHRGTEAQRHRGTEKIQKIDFCHLNLSVEVPLLQFSVVNPLRFLSRSRPDRALSSRVGPPPCPHPPAAIVAITTIAAATALFSTPFEPPSTLDDGTSQLWTTRTMTPPDAAWYQLIAALHASGRKAALAITGGGSGAIGELLRSRRLAPADRGAGSLRLTGARRIPRLRTGTGKQCRDRDRDGTRRPSSRRQTDAARHRSWSASAPRRHWSAIARARASIASTSQSPTPPAPRTAPA